MDGGTMGSIALVAGAVLLVYFAVEGRDARLKKQAAQASAAPPRQIAFVEQYSKMNGTGVFGVVLLVTTFLVVFLILIASKTVFGEIEAGIVMIVGTLLSGIALVIGRTRSYSVYRLPRAVISPPQVRSPAASTAEARSANKPEEPAHRWPKWSE
jgi:hypothetical protein